MPGTQPIDRDLAWDGCSNARDLRGLPASDPDRQIGRIVRCDAAANLTPGGWDAVRTHRVTTIVDLRSAAEAQLDPVLAPDGVHYRPAPIIDAVHDSERRLTARRPEWPGVYPWMLDRYQARFAAAVAAVAEGAPDGVAVHCRIGRDRTGLVVALVLTAAGVPRDLVVADYALSNARLRPGYDQRIAAASSPAEAEQLRWESSPPSDLVTTALDHLDRQHGGARRYLAHAGVEIDALVERVTEPR